jgi:hypothetical protein
MTLDFYRGEKRGANMNRWKWQTIAEIVKAFIAKGQYGYAFALTMTVVLVPVVLACVALVRLVPTLATGDVAAPTDVHRHPTMERTVRVGSVRGG